MNKILGLSLALILVAGLIGFETYAYSVNNEPSVNSFAAGTLDLKTDDADGVSQTLYAAGMSPGATLGSTITLKNSGTTDGATLDIAFSYTESDGSPNVVDKTANATAGMMEVTVFNYGGPSLLDGISDANGNGYKDVFDLINADLTGQTGLATLVAKDFDISVRLRSETGNDFQSDGIVVSMTFILKQ